MTGVAHLAPGEGEELLKLILDFMDAHAVPSKEKSPSGVCLYLL